MCGKMSVASGPSHSMDVGEPQRYSLRRGGERKRRGPKPKPQTASMSKYRRREANARYNKVKKAFEDKKLNIFIQNCLSFNPHFFKFTEQAKKGQNRI